MTTMRSGGILYNCANLPTLSPDAFMKVVGLTNMTDAPIPITAPYFLERRMSTSMSVARTSTIANPALCRDFEY